MDILAKQCLRILKSFTAGTNVSSGPTVSSTICSQMHLWQCLWTPTYTTVFCDGVPTLSSTNGALTRNQPMYLMNDIDVMQFC